jgi:SAM-dependent methyltransferase
MIFRQAVLDHLRRDHVLLDIGAGAGIVPETNFRRLAAKVIGVDQDMRVMQNTSLDEAHVASCAQLPLSDSSVDIVTCDNVLEHLDDPLAAFAEVHRVLKPGGIFIAKTPNKWHYMPTIARLTPTSFHRWFNKRRGRNSEDTFPTIYRANCERDIRKLGSATGLVVSRIQHIESRPEYLRFSAATYLLGVAYERLVNCHELMRRFRVVLLVTLHRK